MLHLWNEDSPLGIGGNGRIGDPQNETFRQQLCQSCAKFLYVFFVFFNFDILCISVKNVLGAYKIAVCKGLQLQKQNKLNVPGKRRFNRRFISFQMDVFIFQHFSFLGENIAK